MKTIGEMYAAIELQHGSGIDRFFKWTNRVSWLVIASVLAYFFYFEVPPIKYVNVPFPVLAPIVFPGDPIVMHIERISSLQDDYSFRIDRWLINTETGERFTMPYGDQQMPPGFSTKDSTNNIVPADFLAKFAPGCYVLRGKSQVDGTVRNFRIEWRSRPFTIAKPGPNRTSLCSKEDS